MVHLVLVHGRSQEFSIPVAVQRELEEGLRWGLERVAAPYYASIPVRLAYYGDHWRPDATALELPAPLAPEPTVLQRRVAADMLAAAGVTGALETQTEGAGWGTLNRFATFLDQHLHLGNLVVRVFLEDVERYFGDVALRSQAIDRVADAVVAANDDVVLLGHSLGSVVAYDALHARPDLPVRGFITLGSPLGLPTVLRRLGAWSFPPMPARWANVFDPDDFVTGRVVLRPHFPARDGRAVEDLEIEGRPPGLTAPTAAHDAAVYLSSIALATALRGMADAEAARLDGVADAERSAAPGPAPLPTGRDFHME